MCLCISRTEMEIKHHDCYHQSTGCHFWQLCVAQNERSIVVSLFLRLQFLSRIHNVLILQHEIGTQLLLFVFLLCHSGQIVGAGICSLC